MAWRQTAKGAGVQVNVIHGRVDKRATHRIFSEPVALDHINDATAHVHRIHSIHEEINEINQAMHMISLGVGDEHLVNGAIRIHDKLLLATDELSALLATVLGAAGLVEESLVVDPYRAMEVAV